MTRHTLYHIYPYLSKQPDAAFSQLSTMGTQPEILHVFGLPTPSLAIGYERDKHDQFESLCARDTAPSINSHMVIP